MASLLHIWPLFHRLLNQKEKAMADAILGSLCRILELFWIVFNSVECWEFVTKLCFFRFTNQCMVNFLAFFASSLFLYIKLLSADLSIDKFPNCPSCVTTQHSSWWLMSHDCRTPKSNKLCFWKCSGAVSCWLPRVGNTGLSSWLFGWWIFFSFCPGFWNSD